MRLFALHDTEGKIARIVASPEGAPPMLPTVLEPGQSVTEIALPEEIAGSADADTVEKLLDLVKQFRVDIPAIQPAQLSRKDR